MARHTACSETETVSELVYESPRKLQSRREPAALYILC